MLDKNISVTNADYGKIIPEKRDEKQNCEIIFEVYRKRLKRKVENAAFE